MQPSPEEAGRVLREVDQQRRTALRSVVPGWPLLLAVLALTVGIGLVQDLAPRWSGVTFLSAGAVALIVGLGSRTRHGGALVGRRVLPRTAIGRPGRAPTSPGPTRHIIAVVVLIAAAVLMGFAIRHAAARPWWPHGFPNTVTWVGGWAVAVMFLMAYSAWLRRSSASS